LRIPIDWADKQFRSLGRSDAHDLAIDLMAAYEAARCRQYMRDPNVLTSAARPH